jgi:quercetin dioxygenase-like cupin family protein
MGGSEPVSLLVTGDQTQGQFALVETVVRRTEEPPLHSHTRENEFVYVVQGEVKFYLDGNGMTCAAGDHVFLPKGSEHTYSIESEEARMLVLLMPAGLEGYYQEMNKAVDVEQSIERLITVSARYGMEIMGPGPAEDTARSGDLAYQGGGETPAHQE